VCEQGGNVMIVVQGYFREDKNHSDGMMTDGMEHG
jgi:hypothetical protein